jgi:hypothetical protein
MAHLGDFGAAVKELDPNAERDTFNFFGEKFEIVDDLPPMLIFQLAASMTGKVAEEEGMGAMWSALNVSLDEPDLEPWDGEGKDPRPAPKKQFAKLYKLAVSQKADIPSMMELVMNLFQASGGERPTAQVSDSQAGLSPTSPSSNTSSSVPPAFGGEPHDATTPTRLRSVAEVLAG